MSTEFERSPYYEAHRTFNGVSGLMPEVIRPSTTKGLEYATAKIKERIANFQSFYFEKHPEKQLDEGIVRLFNDMNTAGYWHVLNRIDGNDASPHGKAHEQERLERGIEARKWAKANFTEEELRAILGIVIDTALMGIHSNSGQPGFRRGHTILYSHLVTKAESMFAGLPSPALIKRLNNGRLWENLAYLHVSADQYSKEVKDVLSSHREDLDPDFFEQGYEIFKRNNGEDVILGPCLFSLQDTEVMTYWGFVQELDQSVYVKKEKEERKRVARENRDRYRHETYYTEPPKTDSRIAFLVKPYLHYLHLHTPLEHRRFDDRTREDRFSDPVLQKYLEESDMLREALAQDLQDYLEDAPDYAGSILYNIPQPREMISRLLVKIRSIKPDDWSKHESLRLKGISRMLRATGIDLRNLLNPNDTPLTKKPVEV